MWESVVLNQLILLVGVVTVLHFAWYLLCALGRANKAFDTGFGMSPLDHAESDEEGWEQREASRTHSVKFTEDTEPAEAGKEVSRVQEYHLSIQVR